MEAKPSVSRLKRLKDFGSDRSHYLRLDKNERTLPFSDKDVRNILSKIDGNLLSMYPDQSILYRKLADFLKIDEQSLLLTAGSDAAIKGIFETYVSPGHEVVLLDPTYAMVEVYADLFEAKKIKVSYPSDLKLNVEQFLAAIKPGAKVVFIANPNQPTGSVFRPSDLKRVADHCQKLDVLLVIDEAYIAFSSQDSMISQISQYSNLVVTQTFSKGLGLAAARLGFVASQSKNIDQLYKVKTLSDINLLALVCGEYLLDYPQVWESYVSDVKEGRSYVAAELAKLDLMVIPSEANFVHIRFPENVDLNSIANALEERKILVRIAGKGLPAVLQGCMRISIGCLAQMQEFVQALKEVLLTIERKGRA